MRIPDARQQLVRTAKNLQRLLPNLEAFEKCLRENKMHAHIDKVLSELAFQTKPFHRIEAIENGKKITRPSSCATSFWFWLGRVESARRSMPSRLWQKAERWS